MQPNKFSVVLLSLIARICATGIILKSSEPDGDFEVDEAAINVITSCYGNPGNAVGVGGGISGNLVKRLSSQKIPVVLVDNSTGIAVKYNVYQRTFRYNLQVFVIAASTVEEFKKSTVELKRSVWWNHMASFLILYRSSQGCGGAELLLSKAWSHNMINAKVICFDRRLGTWILEYNPYTSQAPEQWRIRTTFPNRRIKNNNFTVFERPYREGKEICKNLTIDKMKNLNGYPIELVFQYYGKLKHRGQEKHSNNYLNLNNNALYAIIRALNGIGVRVVLNLTTKPLKNIPFRDMYLSAAPLLTGLQIPMSRTFMENGLVIMTQFSGNMSQLQKILSVVDIYSNIGVGIVLLVTLVFFKFFVRQALMPAFLNIVRIVCNTGFTNFSKNTPSRLYLTGVLLFAVTMQGIYQGNLASLLTTEVPLRNVDTWQDLIDLDHTIYFPPAIGYEMLVQNPLLKGRAILTNGIHDCSDYVLRDSLTACIDSAHILMDQAEELKLHLSQMIKPSLIVYVFRKDWVHEAQFNLLLGRLYETGVIVPFKLRMKEKTLADFKFHEDVKNNQEFRNMTLRDLIFAFVILGIGLVCASISFIFEIVIYRFRSTIRTRRVHF